MLPSSRTYTIVSAAIIAALLIGALALANVSRQQPSPSTYLPPTPTRETTKQSMQESTEAWELYRNEDFGFALKYPPSRHECNPTHVLAVCITADDSFDFEIAPLRNIPETFDYSGLSCGKTFEDCLASTRAEFRAISFEREKPSYAVELGGSLLDGGTRRVYLLAVHGGVLRIAQNRFSPELDALYEQLLLTIELGPTA